MADGAGVNPDKVIKPSKRVRNQHRHAMRGLSNQVSLRTWVRAQRKANGDIKPGRPGYATHSALLAWCGAKGLSL